MRGYLEKMNRAIEHRHQGRKILFQRWPLELWISRKSSKRREDISIYWAPPTYQAPYTYWAPTAHHIHYIYCVLLPSNNNPSLILWFTLWHKWLSWSLGDGIWPSLAHFQTCALLGMSAYMKLPGTYELSWCTTKHGVKQRRGWQWKRRQMDREIGGQVGRDGRKKSYPSQQLSLTPVLPDCQHVITLSENPSRSIVGY